MWKNQINTFCFQGSTVFKIGFDPSLAQALGLNTVCVSDPLTFADNSQMAATVRRSTLISRVCWQQLRIWLLHMSVRHKSLLFVNKSVSLHFILMLSQICGSREQTFQASLTSTLITLFLKNTRCLSLYSGGLVLPALTAFGPMCSLEETYRLVADECFNTVLVVL